VGNAVRFLVEGGADVVKLEVDGSFTNLVKRLSSAGVPVVAHLGSRPQLKRLHGGGSRKIYRTQAHADATVEDALRMVEAGAVMLLFEAVPAEIPQQVSRSLQAKAEAGELEYPVPIVGCGAGPGCDGHVIVLHDLLGLSDWHAPFAKPMAQMGSAIQNAAAQWVKLIASGQYLRDDHPYKIGG
jgi:3-methyl-2-oxobutanoate hydroxymethyltransferase